MSITITFSDDQEDDLWSVAADAKNNIEKEILRIEELGVGGREQTLKALKEVKAAYEKLDRHIKSAINNT